MTERDERYWDATFNGKQPEDNDDYERWLDNDRRGNPWLFVIIIVLALLLVFGLFVATNSASGQYVIVPTVQPTRTPPPVDWPGYYQQQYLPFIGG